MFKQVVLAAALTALSGCTTVTDWFADDDEIKIRRIPAIVNQVTPKVIWNYSIGDGVDEYFSRLQPAYADNTIYAAERHGKVVALEPDSGDVKWQRNFAIFRNESFFDGIANIWRSGTSAKISAMAAGYDKVFVGSENGKLLALDGQTGETVWEASVAGEILAPPAMDEGILVVNTGAGVLFGFDAQTGEQLWRSETDVPPLSLRGISAPAASNGGTLIGTPTGKLQVNILTTGIPAWETAITAPSGATELERIIDVDSSPVLYGSTVYIVSYDGTLAALELRSGRILWKREYGSYRDLAVTSERIYVVDTRSNVFALDRRNGIEIWSQGGLRQRHLTAPVVMGEHVVVGDRWGLLHWLNTEDGTLAARYDLGGDDEDEAIYAAPIKVDDMIVTITRDGDIAALTAQ
ncbi:outer membrane protein assembly factor BamB [Alteromonas sp. chi3]|uniref:Outer membrane protein assembly factor BamB n=2 Tax=Alteromonas gilva TaxID=2987522 RepID=A0ABT5L9I3_9ALTE|nr:outer membrane protein assembly factor BamB [Alteromonas gilva]MDC8832703.1 outer membrane protein assembly factor BamB [Alteromonas gilva]